MRSPALILAAVLIAVSPMFSGCGKSLRPTDPAAVEVERILADGKHEVRFESAPDPVWSAELVREFYKARRFAPAWSDENGIHASADSLRSALKLAEREGLESRSYHLEAIESLLGRIRGPIPEQSISVRAELDLLLTDAFLLYACHLAEGKVDRDSLSVRRPVASDGRRYVELLDKALSSGNVAEALRALVPSHRWYRALKDLLSSVQLRKKTDAWPRVPSGHALKPGDAGAPVFALRSRLLALGDLNPRSGSTSDAYDSTLVDAVRIFQKRHGYEPTGIADSATLAAMAISTSKRIEQIKVTMERWRWLPHALGKKHVIVNIPDFMLQAVENDRVVFSTKVVLGQPAWPTPVFSSAMEQVLFNSHWMAPEDIVEKELINYMKADSNYLPSNMMSLWRREGDSLVKVNPKTLNWAEMTPEKIDFFLRQEGGPQNIMGQVKFLVPNKYNVYLHDTPYREDFPKNVRMFSHGCIRLEKPFDFAEFVLQQFPEWTRAKIDTIVARRTEQSIRLKTAIPVHVVYATVWRDQDGSVQFRDDYYGLDRKLAAVLLAR